MAAPPFQLSKASFSDIPELSELMYHCFDCWTITRFMGCFSTDDLPRAAARYEKITNEDPADIWLKVVNSKTGKIIAASNWKLYLDPEKAKHNVRDELPEWISEELKDESAAIAKPVLEMRVASNPEPFLYLNFCYTEEKYRRRGAGSMMMQWGNHLADILFLPCWVEASSDGTRLYKTFGYHETSVMQLGGDAGNSVVGMRREVRTKAIEGGKTVINGTQVAKPSVWSTKLDGLDVFMADPAGLAI